ncbi:CpsD/CapB family tyrosine-protein kinase [Macrococcus equipercicus]|uniref:non-specific protein-tyrosine kinase n=1 Tax=Macrococcus equipercicus TaxID=69967 RepID=A0A9Q9F134_9STAP|nr:CpsD/CapB family tyrosine-protein kinase [Macrococcus equipercicus]UTH13603.1 CpsD/CapB family tyrosine-protein kinase [Macrococcus equipercicus]
MAKKKKSAINQLEVMNRPKSVISEQFRTLRTNILFTSSDREIKRVMITSSEPGEGKSTVTANTATAFAQAGYRTLVLDADMRKPTQHKIFELSNAIGLSNLIAGQVELEAAIKQTEVNKLDLITSGPIPPNPSELIGSTAMELLLNKLDQVYDIIIIDTAPVLAVTDSKIVANLVDGSLLVVNANHRHREKVIAAKAELEKSEAKILGVVLNELDVKEEGSNYYYYAQGE